MNKSNRLLIILSKNPEAGMVKTRLAHTIGDKKALEIYETLRQHTARVADKVHAERQVFFSRFIPSFDLFLTSNFSVRLQEGDDLGERMLHAIKSGFESGFHHVMLIGTDCYELNPAILEEAFSVLERADAVIGPATDGGFYLIGMNRVMPELFLDRKWSTPDVLGKTIAILKQLDTPYELLVELPDIDTFDDLKKSPLWTCKP
ncbi:MAG: TIGR04282 family arsenosugar biosynthesis glycosyltransferase [Chlorobiaceae bacterium]